MTSTKGRLTLWWTEYVYLAAIGMAGIIASGEAWLDMRLELSSIKHVPLILTLAAFYFNVLGRKIFKHTPASHQHLLIYCWPFLLLAIFSITGSIYARFIDGTKETFLILGSYMLIVYVSAMFIMQSNNPWKLLRAYIIVLWFIVILIAVAAFFQVRGDRSYLHEKQFIVLPMVLIVVITTNHACLKWSGVLLAFAWSLWDGKNTSFIVGAIVVVYAIIYSLYGMNAKQWLKRLIVVILLAVLLAVTITAIYPQLESHIIHYQQSTNTTYRLWQYRIAWTSFIRSPVWGNLFTGNSGERFDLWIDRSLETTNLPTHNDVLDIAKNGGTMAILLWILGIYFVWKVVRKKIFEQASQDDWRRPFVHLMIGMSSTAIIVYLFNPVLLKPGKAYLIWTNIGFLLGLALRQEKNDVPIHRGEGQYI